MPGSCIKDPAGDISIFNERAGPRAGTGCLITFIRAAQSGDGRVAQMEAENYIHAGSKTHGHINIYLNYVSQHTQDSPLKTAPAVASFLLIFCAQSPFLFPFPKEMNKDIELHISL